MCTCIRLCGHTEAWLVRALVYVCTCLLCMYMPTENIARMCIVGGGFLGGQLSVYLVGHCQRIPQLDSATWLNSELLIPRPVQSLPDM